MSRRPPIAWSIALTATLVLPLAPAWAEETQEQASATEADPAPQPPEQCSTGSAPDAEAETRAERLKRKRCEKARLPPAPYAPGFLERNMLAFQKAERPSIMSFNVWDIYPRLQGIARGSRNAVGLRLWKPEIAPSLDVHASVFYSINNYEFYDVQIGRIPHEDVRMEAAAKLPLRSTKGDDVFEVGTLQIPDGKGWMAYASARYEHYTRLNYFGTGPDSKKEDRTTFLGRGGLYELRGGYQFSKNFLVTGSVGYQNARVGPGEDEKVPSVEEVFDDETAPGLDDPPDYLKYSIFFLFDSRDRAGNPTRGAMLGLEYSHYDDRDEGNFTFNRVGADLRGFIPLGSPQRVLALRAYAVLDDTVGDARVPFYMQPFLGGSHTLRGFRNFRFRGESMLLLSAEYRWEPVPPVEFAFLVDTGTVSEVETSLDFDKLQTNWGVSLRFKVPHAYLFRMDWAIGPEDKRFLLRFSPAW